MTILGIPEIFHNSICIIEWPQRMGNSIPADALQIQIKISSVESRAVTISSHSPVWSQRFQAILPELAVQQSEE